MGQHSHKSLTGSLQARLFKQSFLGVLENIVISNLFFFKKGGLLTGFWKNAQLSSGEPEFTSASIWSHLKGI